MGEPSESLIENSGWLRCAGRVGGVSANRYINEFYVGRGTRAVFVFALFSERARVCQKSQTLRRYA